MKKPAKELKKGDRIIIAGKTFIVENIEISDIGKQGTKKVRIEAKTEQGEKIVIIRPEDYPFETE
jgi:translation elongation factor P/translation initiation factor 5A